MAAKSKGSRNEEQAEAQRMWLEIQKLEQSGNKADLPKAKAEREKLEKYKEKHADKLV